MRGLAPRWQRRAVSRALMRQSLHRLRRLHRVKAINGVGIGLKTRRGQPTRHVAAITYVAHKEAVHRHRRVPRRIKVRVAAIGRHLLVPTDVVAAPERGQACTIRGGDYVRANDAATCTISWRADRDYVITCAHCFFAPSRPDDPNNCKRSNCDGLEIWDPDPGRHRRAALVDQWSGITLTGINTNDDARAVLRAGFSSEHLRMGRAREPLIRVAGFNVSARAEYFYLTETGEHRCRNPVAHVGGDPLPVVLDTPDGQVTALYASYFSLAMVDQDVEHGNSGAAILRRVPGGLEWAGLLFGMLGPRTALAFSAVSIARRHGVPLP